MRLALFGDIHGNIEALSAVVDHMAANNVHRYMCLGDIVGYGASPNECIDVIRSLPRMNCVLGNHDAAAVWRYSPYSMTRDAKEVILWTIDLLTEENAAFLQQLPPMLSAGDLCFVHANPYNPEAYRYVIDRKYAMRSFASARQRLTFIGHSHRPLIITKKTFFQLTFEPAHGSMDSIVSGKKKRIINCGSVGQPRDGDPRACYCLFDTRQNKIEFHRVEYDINGAAQKIKAAGLPDFLSRRLTRGR